MPTGYTAKLCEGPQKFDEFAMDCARAFGALVMLRDDMTAPIPDEFKPSDYSSKALNEAERSVKKFEAMTDATAAVMAQNEFEIELEKWGRDREHARDRARRLEGMEREVMAWTPPTPDHQGLKKFMLEQLATTKDFDTYDGGPKPTLKTPAEFKRAGLQKALENRVYHMRENAKEVERARERTEWVRALRRSLTLEAAKGDK
jgi:hypothetical protein